MLLFNFADNVTLELFFRISIHPMLLFNKDRSKISVTIFHFNASHVIIQHQKKFPVHFCRNNFNASHVIIQPTKNRHSCILLISINHNLKPFFQHFTNHSIENHLFVKNHVFTPFDRLFQKITW